MGPLLLWLWILSLHSDAQQHPDPEEGSVQPVWRTQGARGPAPPLMEDSEPALAKRSGEKLPGWESADRSPHVRGRRCCVGRAPSKTRRCTRPRCFPLCQNRALCLRSNRCVCRRGFLGYRCEFSSETSTRRNISTHGLPALNRPVSTRKKSKSARAGLNSTSTPAKILKEATKMPDSGSDMFAVKPEEAVAETKQVPLKREQVKVKMKESRTPMGLEPEFTSSRSWTRNIQEQTETTMSDSESVVEEILPHTEPKTRTEKGETSKPWILSFKQGSKTEALPSSKTSTEPEEDLGLLDWRLGSTLQEREARNSEMDSSPKPSGLESNPDLRGKTNPDGGATRREETREETREVKTGTSLSLRLREAQSELLRTALSEGGHGPRLASLLMKHIEKEQNKLGLWTSSPVTTSVKTFHTQRGQYTVHVSAPTADGQAATGGGGLERIQVMFTPTICKMRCSQDRCVNYCERGNVTTLYSSSGGGAAGAHGPGFRVFLCPLLCKNGGICWQKDRCICPPSFTGKFCQISVFPTASPVTVQATPSSTNDIMKPVRAGATHQELTQSEFLLPLGQRQEAARSGAPGPNMVKVRVQHPPEASVKIHQVVKVAGSGPTLRTLSSSGSAGAPAPASRGIQAQTVRGGGAYTQQSGFKYCFREVKDGQCSSPLPGLRSRDMCCRGPGKGWGIADCVLCPDNTGPSNSSCPAGSERANGTQCVDVNECLLPGLCENGICVNTRGSYSCVCRVGFILDATHGICISQSVISEEKGQCYRVLGSGRGSSSCSLPILRNITKQICCCSRVGKAWGRDCQRCPHFGSVSFKEICPAGPGYHYSASGLQFNQRVSDQLPEDNQGSGPGSSSSRVSGSQQKPSSGGASVSQTLASSAGSGSTQSRTTPAHSLPRPVQPGSTDIQDGPEPPSTIAHGGGSSSAVRPDQAPARGDSFHAPALPQSPGRGSRPSAEVRPIKPADSATTRPRVQSERTSALRGVCETRPGVCGRGRCVDRPGGKHTCVCDQGFQPNTQHTLCQDVNECVQSPGVCSAGECVNVMGSYRCVCPPGYRSSIQQTSCQDIDECQRNNCTNGRCENTPGSYRCVCRLGYRLTGNTCTDVDECRDPLQCPGQECINAQGSYRCVSCQPGYGLLHGLCTDVDECRAVPCGAGRCENTPGSFRCVCSNGYRLQNNTCADVDECAEPSQCPGQMCVNTVGSYLCVSCRPGYTLTNRQCADVNECEDTASCPGQRCVNTDGSYRCLDCRPGYSSRDGSCRDVDECESVGACDSERVCVNTVGSFRCDCLPGYRTVGLGRQCRDVNECLEGDFCFSGGECVNTAGSYTCVCSQGFTLSDDGTACVDVDECVKPGVCSDGRCVNTEGSFQCQCRTGFTPDPENTACLDVDECVSSSGSVCASRRCENTIGSFHCLDACEPGFRVTHSGQCEDVNECSGQTVCGHHGVCHNLMGTYECVCDQGFASTPDRKECVASDSSPPSSPSSRSFHYSVVDLGPVLSPPPAARAGDLRECYYSRAEWGVRSLLAANISQQECCCTVGGGWGLGSQHDACPAADSADFLSLCPSGRGYVTTGPGAFSYRDVDECKRFHPEVCKKGVCVNNIPGYSCYCPSGYVYNSKLLECVDHDECEEESCEGGECVNTVGSYYCRCPPPLVLDSTQRNCVNSSDLNVDENLSVCWQHLSFDLMCQSPLLGAQVTYVDCCCLYGVGWGMECAICPPVDFEDYYYLCSSVRAPLFPESLPDSTGPEAGRGVNAPPRFPPYGPDSLPPAVVPDYDDYSPAGGSRSSFRGRTPATFGLPERTYPSEYSTGRYSEGEHSPEGSPPRPPSLHLPPDPRAERAFGARPPPPSQPDGPPLRLAPLPGSPYEEEEEESWRPAPFPPFTERRGGGGTPRRVYERRYESFTGLSTAEDCGILHGCENGRCIRVAEGYTCDCYQGYELDMTSMTCIDKNECEDAVGLEFPCVNARCVNTEGSFRCVCRRGYVMSRRTNHCVAA